MLDTWARVFSAQLRKGDRYGRHRPLIAMWVLERRFLSDSAWLHAFRPHDPRHGLDLGECFLIVTIELEKRAALPDLGEGTIQAGDG